MCCLVFVNCPIWFCSGASFFANSVAKDETTRSENLFKQCKANTSASLGTVRFMTGKLYICGDPEINRN